MEISQIIPHVEALIFAADRPLPMLEILDLLNNALAFLEDRATADQVEAAIEAIREKYSSEFYAFEVRSSGGGFQFLTKRDYYQTVAQLNGDKFLKRLSTAALETLAIIAYRQPISKGEIEYIRGVSTDYSIQKLLEKELIVISGRSEDLPGKPLLYTVSRGFMDYFGINSPADLPKLKELFDEEMIQPTLITDETATIGRDDIREEQPSNDNEYTNEATPEEIGEDGHTMMVSEDGELLDPDHQLDELPAAPAETPAPPAPQKPAGPPTPPAAEHSDFHLMDQEHESLPASEDEEAEPDDEIINFESFLRDAEEDRSGAAEDEDAEPDDEIARNYFHSKDENEEEEEDEDEEEGLEDDEDEEDDFPGTDTDDADENDLDKK
ncbi:SMC-Scp complex subunit ScpB [Chitinophaga sp. Cy-1792]|uniref:SMC-Scp complex subunit ScpB n=1 Tax=Chitinophaga sp. Cy-1792 TaxID=2608339 RepID=UPI00142316EB|nr:SMC-Scp complex subunit ScpB [Chitinophaga sp. Cy-1792]NIG53037.1 SMC-Scp complex subunit ScpB [Chitinophaga sp. Cy-1792]